jgi:hypothetical protein
LLPEVFEMARAKRVEFAFNLFLFVIGISVVAYGLYYGISDRSRPGPGLFPFLSGLLMALASVVRLFSAAAPIESEEPTDYGLLIRVGVIVAIMVCVVVLAEPLGLLLATIAMMTAIGIACGDTPRTYRFAAGAMAVAIVFGILNHLFFKLLLRVPLLEGPFDFLMGPAAF